MLSIDPVVQIRFKSLHYYNDIVMVYRKLPTAMIMTDEHDRDMTKKKWYRSREEKQNSHL